MLFIYRDGKYIDCSGLAFDAFMGSGFKGYQATVGDYALHLSTLFPDVRLKRFLEIRGADMGSRFQVLSLPALFKGLFYHEPSLDALDTLFDGIDAEASRKAAMDAARRGLRGTLQSRALADWAERVVEIAQTGLQVLEPEPKTYLESLLPKAHQRQKQAIDGLLDAGALLESTRL